jgi:outer membrane protein TolC
MICGSLAYGQAGGDTLMLSLDSAKAYALEHNRDIKNASFAVQKAEANRWKAIASMLPQISGKADYTNMCGYEMTMNMGGGSSSTEQSELELPESVPAEMKPIVNDIAGAIMKKMSEAGSTTTNIAMPPYFSFGGTAAMAVSGAQIVGVQLAKMSKRMQEVNINKTAQEISANIEKSYVNILALQSSVALLNSNLGNLEKLMEMTQNAVKVGVAEQNDADQIAIQVAAMKSGINTLERTIEVLYNSLLLSMGAKPNATIVLTQKLEDIVNLESILQLLNTELDLNNNYSYQLVNIQTELARKQVTSSKMSYVPQLSAAYVLNKKVYVGDEAKMDMQPPHTVNIGLSIPIFSSGVNWAGVRAAKCDYASAINTLEQTEEGLMIQDKQLRFNLSSAYENYQIQSNNMEVMQNVFNSYSEKFKYGVASSMQVTTSSTELVNAQNDYVTSLLEMVNAHIELKILLNK